MTLIAQPVTSFNLDLSSITIFDGPVNSQFGYSIGLHINDFTGNKVVVGAPKANTSTLLAQNIVNSGAIFGCSVGMYYYYQ